MSLTNAPTPTRWQPLRISAVVAGAFVVGRVVFRVVFGGAPGAGATLPSLPSVDLPGVFSSVSLFGPVTTGGLIQTIVAALPLAAFVLATGVIFSLVDLRRLLIRSRSWGLGSASLSALLVAMAVLPELRRASQRLGRARRLRGLKGLARVAPLVGSTVERATSLAASLEARGFMGGGLNEEPDCAAPIVCDSLSLCLPGGGHILSNVSLTLPAGSMTLVTGDTGSGKTTVLRAIAGLFESFDHGNIAGTLTVGGIPRSGLSARATAGFIAYLPQDVRSGFVGVTVAEELGMSLALRGMPRARVESRVGIVAREVGVAHLLDRGVEQLSAGEATLVGLAAALCGEPSILLCDEPFADLDEAATARVGDVLRRLATETGMTLVVAEHRIDTLISVATARVHLGDGSARLVDLSFSPHPDVASTHVAHAGSAATPVDIVALVGPNGSGKTTLLWQIALPDGKAASGVRLVPDNPVDLFQYESVAEECHIVDGAAHLMSSLVRGNIARQTHPRDLSTGEQRALAISLQMAAHPHHLLIDEPTRGLDAVARQQLASDITEMARTGTRVIIATHDVDFAALLGARIVPMSAGPGVDASASLRAVMTP